MLQSYQTSDLALTLVQSNWSTQLNPLLSNPSLQTTILQNVALVIGTNKINHLLGRKLQGWRIVRQRSAANIYDDQDSNQTPAQTLWLVSDAVVSCNIEVF